MNSIPDETRYKLLKQLEENPSLSQRELANAMGISLGKVNYCLKSLIDRGFVKAGNFYNSNKKTAYIYTLTPKGIEEKMRVTYRFLKRKMEEYEDIKEEISRLKSETEEFQQDTETRSVND